MSERSTLRGSRLGAVSYEDESGVTFAERRAVEYECPRGHLVRVPMAIEAEEPRTWDCPQHGVPATLIGPVGEDDKPVKPARTHWDMLLERRPVTELEVLLEERLDLLRAGRLLDGEGDAPHVSPTVKTRRGRKTA
jgi:hypothetical protein